eukprot:2469045-Lingulodinium_polyedra.AAC.1
MRLASRNDDATSTPPRQCATFHQQYANYTLQLQSTLRCCNSSDIAQSRTPCADQFLVRVWNART